MASKSAVDLIAVLKKYRLLPAGQLAEVEATQEQFADARALAQELLKRDWLTSFQIQQIAQGQAKQLLFGPYVLLQLLGEGGMGKVYKARHQRLGRVVALKFIKPELLDKPEALPRFQREALAAAQLHHPNVVILFDADQVDGTHFCSMEYVDGTNLANLLKEHGRLPIPVACDYIRQTALGLQHAHEHGLVHRDIKPANLMVTRQGVIKILDMGLARGEPVSTHSDTATSVTGEGVVVGTVDYMAPEQAKNSRAVDARSDLYSLGCTLYHLLAGHPPFPEGQGWERLLKHQMEEAAPIEQIRPEVQPELALIVRKLLAKQPENRYQSAAEVASALSPLCQETALKESFAVSAANPREPLSTQEENQAPTEAATPSTVWSRSPWVTWSRQLFSPSTWNKKIAIGIMTLFLLCAGGICLVPKPDEDKKEKDGPPPLPPLLESRAWPAPPLGLEALKFLPPNSAGFVVLRPNLVPAASRQKVQPWLELLLKQGLHDLSTIPGLNLRDVDHEAFALQSNLPDVKWDAAGGNQPGTLAIHLGRPLGDVNKKQILKGVGADPKAQQLDPQGLTYHAIRKPARLGPQPGLTFAWLPTAQTLLLTNTAEEHLETFPGMRNVPPPYPEVLQPLFDRMDGAFLFSFLTVEKNLRKLVGDNKVDTWLFLPPAKKDVAQEALKRALAAGVWLKWGTKHVELCLAIQCANEKDSRLLADTLTKGWRFANFLIQRAKQTKEAEQAMPVLREGSDSLQFQAEQATLVISSRVSTVVMENYLEAQWEALKVR